MLGQAYDLTERPQWEIDLCAGWPWSPSGRLSGMHQT